MGSKAILTKGLGLPASVHNLVTRGPNDGKTNIRQQQQRYSGLPRPIPTGYRLRKVVKAKPKKSA